MSLHQPHLATTASHSEGGHYDLALRLAKEVRRVLAGSGQDERHHAHLSMALNESLIEALSALTSR